MSPAYAELTPEQRRSLVVAANSGRTFKAIAKRVGDWVSGPYATEQQREELAELILRGVGDDAD